MGRGAGYLPLPATALSFRSASSHDDSSEPSLLEKLLSERLIKMEATIRVSNERIFSFRFKMYFMKGSGNGKLMSKTIYAI